MLAVVPARGGSKGLPGKNVRPLAGLPLIAHSLKCAALCPEIDRCVVSTDSDEIAEVARAHGGVVPFRRPPELATDSASLTPVLAHALAEMEKLDGRRYESLLLLQPTNPGRLPEDVARAVALLEADPALDGVVACSEPAWNPFFVGVVEKGGLLTPALPTGEDYVRRQDAPRFMRVNGALYLWRRRWLESTTAHWLDAPQRALEIPEARAFDIDAEDDFELTEWALRTGRVHLPWLEQTR
jgi:N-acylneuraminate cytidylyltransferase